MVVGAVIDMEMTDELRVTVVATGIGEGKKADISLVPNTGAAMQPLTPTGASTMGGSAAIDTNVVSNTVTDPSGRFLVILKLNRPQRLKKRII